MLLWGKPGTVKRRECERATPLARHAFGSARYILCYMTR